MMTLPINRSFSGMGGTGVAPVKSGVTPDFVNHRPPRVVRTNQSQSTSPDGFGRDAQNNRPEACATRTIFWNGGTGVTPVKSGVTPDFVNHRPPRVVRTNQSQSTSPDGFGRDAQNNRPEACATWTI